MLRTVLGKGALGTGAALVCCLVCSRLTPAQSIFRAIEILDSSVTVDVADVDGDGDDDRVAVVGGSDISIEINAGGRVFGPVVSPAGVLPPEWDGFVRVADVDGDGVPDLVANVDPTFPLGAGLLIYAGTGGLLAQPVHVPTTARVVAMERGNGDNDGRADIAIIVSSPTGSAVQWMRGAPGPTFVPSNGIGIATVWGASVFTEDLNSDGLDDLAWYDTVNGAVQTFTTVGVAYLSAGQTVTLPPGWGGSSMATGDVNGNGARDVVLLEWGGAPGGGNQIRILELLNDGIGGLSVAPVQTAAIYSGPPQWVLGDWDGDGDDDLITRIPSAPIPTLWTSALTLYENDGTGGFAFRSSNALNTSDYGLWMSDLDADGFVDFLGPRELLYSDGSFRALQTPVPLGDGPMLDHDGDGDPDRIAELGFYVARNQGDGSFTPGLQVGLPPLASGFSFYELRVVELSGDGQLDAIAAVGVVPVFGAATFVEHRALINDGSGSLTDAGVATLVPNATIPLSSPTLAADLDGDGMRDLVLADNAWFDSGGFRYTPSPTITWAGWTPRDVGDIDGDGDVDVLAVDSASNPGLLINDGTGTGWLLVTLPPVGSLPGVVYTPDVRFVDADDDGDLDAIYQRSQFPMPAQIVIIENQGGTFGTTTLTTGTVLGANIEVVDVTGDGLSDIVVGGFLNASTGNSVTVYPRIGSGLLYGSPRRFRTGDFKTLSDVDGDGDFDLVGRSDLTLGSLFYGPAAGLRRQYGTGTPGTGGIVPILGATGPFRVGEIVTLRIVDAVGGALGGLSLGSQESAVPGNPFVGVTGYNLPWSGLVLLTSPGPFGVGGVGDIQMPVTIDPSLAGVATYLQAGFFDPAAVGGFSATNGLEVRVGQ